MDSIKHSGIHIRQKLLKWFSENGRKFFWRTNPEPFIVLITEILLKKTSANAVERFLPSFLCHFPDAESLANATLVDLKEMLAPLGLSTQRAGQLKNLAEALVQYHNGKVPSHSDSLLRLPGVGGYTVGAVLSFAFCKPAAIVDTNVARVLTRLYGLEPSRFEARRSPEVWEAARIFIGVNSKESRKLNWALLDLGALICAARKPKCDNCPLIIECVYANSNKDMV